LCSLSFCGPHWAVLVCSSRESFERFKRNATLDDLDLDHLDLKISGGLFLSLVTIGRLNMHDTAESVFPRNALKRFHSFAFRFAARTGPMGRTIRNVRSGVNTYFELFSGGDFNHG